jgi:hypothetical protein
VSNLNMRRKQSGKIKTCFTVGCLSVVILIAAGGIGGYFWAKSFLAKMTDAEPRILPTVTLSDEEIRSIVSKLDTFKKEVQEGRAKEPLVLSSGDLNALIQYHPDWKDAAGKVHLTIQDGKVRGEVSIPLDKISPITKGRYLNGSGVFAVNLVSGRLFVFLEALEVKGKAVPESFMAQIRAKNMVENTNTDPKFSPILRSLKEIKIEGDRLIVSPVAPLQ